LALQQWFRDGGGFQYSETVQPPPGRDASGQDAVVAFLRNKRGYCVQFASAMAVMARSLGIPARVGVGFLPGDRTQDGRWEITVRDAHAWPELYFASVGWVRFEPTPGVRAGAAPEWALSPEEAAELRAEPTPTASGSGRAPQTGQRDEPTTQTPQVAEARDRSSLWSRVTPALVWVTWALLLSAVLGALPWVLARSVRWVRWRRVTRRPPGDRVEAAWDELRERLEDLGVRWAASWTPRALQTRLVADHTVNDTARAALGRLVADTELVRYAMPATTVPEIRRVADLRGDVDAIVQTVAASVPERTRRRARLFPSSGLRALRSMTRHTTLSARRDDDPSAARDAA
jgi:hypothetical protein